MQTAHLLVIRVEVELTCHALSLLAIFIACAAAAQLPLPYYHLHQRSTYGTLRWANSLLLRDLQLARRQGKPLQSGELPLGGIGTNADVVLNAAQTMCHLALFGPPVSGKSATFFMTWLRAWSASGSTIVLDPKGELYEQTAYKFERVYRIDLQEPRRSDRTESLSKPEVILAAVNRPAVSFGQLMNLQASDFQPEYDPDQLDPSRDPSFNDSLER